MGYGGFTIGITGGWNRLVHPTFTLLIGGGSVNYFYADHPNYHYHESVISDEFFVLEPSLGIEMNITTFMRTELSAGYRMVSGVQMYHLDNNDIGGPTGGILFKFGKF
ncbi:hypothetical protein KKH27_05225 [bacterium]|nr:hypothetical protein [bacterium]MBU1985227.1 hypothetical protein [bacterium]